jgi:hypothetical protein
MRRTKEAPRCFVRLQVKDAAYQTISATRAISAAAVAFGKLDPLLQSAQLPAIVNMFSEASAERTLHKSFADFQDDARHSLQREPWQLAAEAFVCCSSRFNCRSADGMHPHPYAHTPLPCANAFRHALA